MANVIKKDTGKVILDNPLYQNDTFTYTLTANTLPNNVQYKWTLKTYSGTASATSRETPFFAYNTPTLTMTVPEEITSKKFLFQAIYTQAQSIPINRFYMVFMDNSDKIILQTPYSYSAKLSFLYDGFISGNQYKVYAVVENQMNVITQSPTYSFSVLYSATSLNFVPTVSLLPELSACKIKWSKPIQIQGGITGESSYTEDVFTEGNTGLHLGIKWDSEDTVDDTTTFDETLTFDEFEGASVFFNTLFGNSLDPNYVEFAVDIPLNFTTLYDYIPDSSFVGGKMIEFEDENLVTYEFGYNTELGCFYYKNELISIFGEPKEFPSNVFLIAVKSIEVLIIVNNQIYEYLKP